MRYTQHFLIIRLVSVAKPTGSTVRHVEYLLRSMTMNHTRHCRPRTESFPLEYILVGCLYHGSSSPWVYYMCLLFLLHRHISNWWWFKEVPILRFMNNIIGWCIRSTWNIFTLYFHQNTFAFEYNRVTIKIYIIWCVFWATRLFLVLEYVQQIEWLASLVYPRFSGIRMTGAFVSVRSNGICGSAIKILTTCIFRIT